MDDLTKEQRHRNMSNIRSTNTKPEEIVRKYLFSKGFRFRKNVRSLPGCPDIVLPKYKTVIFVNGCFWHMHNCKRFKWPSTNIQYWKSKILKNVKRDKKSHEELIKLNWRVIVIWECELKRSMFEKTMEQVIKMIKNID